MRRRGFLAVLLIGGFVLGLSPARAQYPPRLTSGLTCSPVVVPQGGSTNCTAFGFGGNVLTPGQFFSFPRGLGPFRSDREGVVKFTLPILLDDPIGRHTVQLSGPNPLQRLITLRTTIRVVAAAGAAEEKEEAAEGALAKTGGGLPLALLAGLAVGGLGLLATGVRLARPRRRSGS